MRRSLPWLLLGAGIVAVAVLTLFSGQQAPPSTHASTSDAGDGTSALARAAATGGHQVVRLESSPSTTAGLLFLFSPNLPYSSLEVDDISRYVTQGGVLVYASETPDEALEGAFGLLRDSGNQVRDLVAYAPGPLLPGVKEVSGGAQAQPFVPAPNQVPLLRGPRQEVLALEIRFGSGRVIAIADPLILCNGYLLRSDNARFAADVLGLAPYAGSSIAFDESHHIPAAASPLPSPGGAAPWVLAIIWAVLALYVLFAVRGRGFGPRIPLAPARARSSAEYVDAVSTLLRRSGGRRQALDILLQATRLALARRVGGRPLPPDRLREALGQRWPDLADRLAEAEHSAAEGERSEAAVLEAARRLHELAVPEGGL